MTRRAAVRGAPAALLALTLAVYAAGAASAAGPAAAGSASAGPDAGGEGARVYSQHCAVCHLPNAGGSPGFVPPLTGTLGHFASSDDGRALLAAIVTWGMTGAIRVGGRSYMGAMSIVRPLSDEEAAEVLNYVLRDHNQASLPADFAPFTAAEVQRHRARKASPGEVHAARQALARRLEAEGKGR